MTPATRATRRLLFAALLLIAADWLEPEILSRLEAARYEDPAVDFRFESSDLFGVAPLVDYLRDHSRGRQSRVAFFGNSVPYGYGLTAGEAVPAQFQRLLPTHKVLNLGVNGFEAGSAWLLAQATIAAFDEAYVLSRTEAAANPLLATLVSAPVAARATVRLPPAQDGRDRRLISAMNRWRLYRDSYRLQAAVFGTSARQFVYLNKGKWIRAVIPDLRAQEPAPGLAVPEIVDAPLASARPSPERIAVMRHSAPPMLWAFADLFTRHQRTGVLLQVPGFAEWLPDADVPDFNRAFFPHVRIVTLRLPPDWTLDNLHVTADGAQGLAAALAQERRRHRDALR